MNKQKEKRPIEEFSSIQHTNGTLECGKCGYLFILIPIEIREGVVTEILYRNSASFCPKCGERFWYHITELTEKQKEAMFWDL